MAHGDAPYPENQAPTPLLLVEDDEALRKFMGLVLRMEGYRLLEAPSGEAALEVVAGFPDPIPLAITDIKLPGLSGHDLANALCRLRPELKVVYISGYTDRQLEPMSECEHQELVLLHKPFTADALVDAVRNVLAGSYP